MSRFIFYLAVALAAFGFGLAAVSEWPELIDEKTIIANKRNVETQKRDEKSQFQAADRNPAPIFFETGRLPAENPKPSFNCRGRQFLPLWNELKKDREFQERAENFDLEAGCAEILEIKKADLNDDARPEFVLWGKDSVLCGATGNCTLWIYEKKNGRYRKLLQSFAYHDDPQEWFIVRNKKSGGYRNLLLKTRLTAAETTYQFYKYENRRYVEKKCLVQNSATGRKNASVMTCRAHNEQFAQIARESGLETENP